ncbi:MAG: thioredoxin domain-containing protein [Sandaracinaceae bacterium]|nr:thioredoxin domain-containing protein [Sandaracinaceae bacterium]
MTPPADRHRARGLWLAVLAASLAAGCGGPRYGFALPDGACREADDDARPWETRGFGMPVPDDAPRRGARRPRVVVQTFSDFECPYCGQLEPTMARLLEEYGACVQVVWRHHPLEYHAHARLAAQAAHEVYRQAGDAAFFRFAALLFADQGRLARADLEARAATIGGVDLARLREALDAGAHAEVVARDQAALDALPTDAPLGAPTVLVNGTLVHGARRYGHFAFRVEEALAEQYGVTRR